MYDIDIGEVWEGGVGGVPVIAMSVGVANA